MAIPPARHRRNDPTLAMAAALTVLGLVGTTVAGEASTGVLAGAVGSESVSAAGPSAGLSAAPAAAPSIGSRDCRRVPVAALHRRRDARRLPDGGPRNDLDPAAVAPSNLPYIVAHETGHQWTPGLVGNDQWADPFADEALADMVGRFTVDIHRASRCATDRLDLPITRYSDACYYEVIDVQGGNWLNTLRTRMGDATYWAAVRGYLATHRFGFGGSRELLDALDATNPVDVAALARPLFPSRY